MAQAKIVPTEIKRVCQDLIGSGIDVVWNNGVSSHISSKTLRQGCPCASCNEKRGDTSHSKPLGDAGSGRGRAMLNVITSTETEELNLEKLWPVGNYALGIRWADQHDSGIYTYNYLWELSQQSPQPEQQE